MGSRLVNFKLFFLFEDQNTQKLKKKNPGSEIMKETRALSIRRAPPSKGRAASGAWVRAPLPALLGVSRFWLLSKRTACAHVPVSRWRLGFTQMQPRSACRLHLAFPIGVRGRAGVGTSGPEHALLQPPPREGEPAQVPSEPHPSPCPQPSSWLSWRFVLLRAIRCHTYLPTKIREVRHVHSFLLTKRVVLTQTL